MGHHTGIQRKPESHKGKDYIALQTNSLDTATFSTQFCLIPLLSNVTFVQASPIVPSITYLGGQRGPTSFHFSVMSQFLSNNFEHNIYSLAKEYENCSCKEKGICSSIISNLFLGGGGGNLSIDEPLYRLELWQWHH